MTACQMHTLQSPFSACIYAVVAGDLGCAEFIMIRVHAFPILAQTMLDSRAQWMCGAAYTRVDYIMDKWSRSVFRWPWVHLGTGVSARHENIIAIWNVFLFCVCVIILNEVINIRWNQLFNYWLHFVLYFFIFPSSQLHFYYNLI